MDKQNENELARSGDKSLLLSTRTWAHIYIHASKHETRRMKLANNSLA